MIQIIPKQLVCHFCETASAEIVFPNGQGLCVKCFTTLSPHLSADDKDLADHKPGLLDLIEHNTLYELSVSIVCFMKKADYTVTAIAKKLGITRATVYTYLKESKK